MLRHAVERKLAAVYGDAWRHHTPSWSKPECRQPLGKGSYACLTELKHAGLWSPTFKPGEQLRVGPYDCAVADAADQCTATANAKGFAMTRLQIPPVGG